MALETVIFQQDPFSYECKDSYNLRNGLAVGKYDYGHGFEEEKVISDEKIIDQWDINNDYNSSPEVCNKGDHGYFARSGGCIPIGGGPALELGRRKRRRNISKSLKNKEDMEKQRMTHIAVERNRRKQMNHYLALLRSIMPPTYAKRGDQASIVGGAINFVKELEQVLQFLQSNKQVNQQPFHQENSYSHLFSNFFTFPQYSSLSTRPTNSATINEPMVEKGSDIADIEVTIVESHANIKVLSRRSPKQLLKMVGGLHSLGLSILHLNVTTVGNMVFYSFNVKVEDDCQLTTVNDIATIVHDMVGKILEDPVSS